MVEIIDHNSAMRSFERSFVRLIKELLRRENYTTIENEIPMEDKAADIIAVSPDGKRTVFEVKIYRTSNIPLMSATFAVRRLSQYMSQFHSTIGILVTNVSLPRNYTESIDFEGSARKIWDLNKLTSMFQKYPDLSEKFTILVNEIQPFRDTKKNALPTDAPLEQLHDVEIDIPMFALGGQTSNISVEIDNSPKVSIAERLISEINAIPLSNEGAKAFEVKCKEIIEFLFAPNVSALTTQSATDEKLHIFDLIGRITAENEFWETLQNHFRAKYVIFEFKNYAEQITQVQIHSTEKYLYLPAMRPVAIIVSRHGANENAHRASRGALREHGKVILNLSVKDICSMLQMKDGGDIPSDYMTTILDDMLMKIER